MYYSCGSKVKSTLRVQSRNRRGLEMYSGLTENTVLSPVKLRRDVFQEDRPTSEQQTSNLLADVEKTSVQTASHIENHVTLEASSDLQTERTSRPHTGPLIACQLLDEPEISQRRSVKLTSYSIFQPKINLNPRPYTAGPRIIVQPKPKCPTGLTSHDVIQGRHLSKMPSSRNEQPLHHNDEINFQVLLKDVKTSKVNINVESGQIKSRQTSTSAHSYRRQHKETREDSYGRPHTTPSTKRSVTFELNIKSILSIRPADVRAEDKAQENSTLIQNKRSSARIKKQRSDSDILELKRRVQSAPAKTSSEFTNNIVTRDKDLVKDNVRTAKPFIEEKRQFSNMYWRARSSYHKKMTDTQIVNDSDQNYVPPKGTLLRPLLYNEDGAIMRHSAGCPYKCKECFKACLVSEDFMETQSRLKTVQKVHVKRQNHPDPLAIVRRALARSQPLFKQVYGDTMDIHPWPTYAWVDIQQTLPKVS
ncbi:hypothetical protein BgiMline_015881 [Biomphalaria glabrata]|uniref:Uncharacterized protein LOC129926973 n=1 Tax=Biomphalaria glabrata TaxID=6526 RepID=A0A9W3ARF9_BIOGL|nr:uncharacterized protein LOC129926973 [Biomphalaria glabrata]KAI8758068.1 hypothetical protein BgiMline_008692 [Biomphalaria glabrata]